MTITITKFRLAVALLAVVSLVPSTAWATHKFTDVGHGPPFEAAINWAADNGITTGTGDGTTFSPDDPVTRAQNVTFAHRYDTNIVQPQFAAMATNLFASDTETIPTLLTATAPVDLGLSAVVTIPVDHTGVIEIGFSAESACYGGTGPSWCGVIVYSNGSAVSDNNFAFDSSDGATESATSWEAHAMTRVTGDLPAGTYTITVSGLATAGDPAFWLDDMVLTATVHLTS